MGVVKSKMAVVRTASSLQRSGRFWLGGLRSIPLASSKIIHRNPFPI